MTWATSSVTTKHTPSTAPWSPPARSGAWCAHRRASWCRSANNSALADLPQDLRGVLAEPRGGAFRGHRRSIDDDRCAHPRDRPVRGCIALELQPQAPVFDLRIGKDLRQRIDRPGRNLHGLELVEKIVAFHARGGGAELLDQLVAACEPVLVGEVSRVVGEFAFANGGAKLLKLAI